MKKALFVINNLRTGGVQSSLLNLLKEIQNRYNITVLCFEKSDDNREKLPKNIHLITVNSVFRYLGVSQSDLKKHPFAFINRAYYAILAKIFGRSFVLRLMFLFQKKIGDYDYAISFLHESSQNKLYGGCNEFVLKKVIARKKITWIHGDFEHCGANCKRNIKIYKRFDQIVSCSEGTKAVFLKCVPELTEKSIAIHNCNDFEKIKEFAGCGEKYNISFFNIITVSRLGEEKGIERAIIAIKECVEKGYLIHYHIIGDGCMRGRLEKLCKEYGIEENVTFYGNQANPYYYMKNADLFLLPSYHEAAPMVFDEAACLGVPVLTTKTISTAEMIEQQHAGIVCENSEKGIVNGLLGILQNIEFLNNIRKVLNTKMFTNQRIIDVISKEVMN